MVHTRDGNWEIRAWVGTQMVVLYTFEKEAQARAIFETVKAKLGTIELTALVEELAGTELSPA
ncbi:hypothetical protein EON83_28215 [bacterium]|nr:MAG: hypothetical protein EON83_28215 [bacterium]